LEIQLRAGDDQRTVAITMRTPGNDYELAAGFLYNEGVIQSKEAITHMIYCVDGQQALQEYNLLRVNLAADHLPDLPQLDRHFFTTSACGVCGRTMLDDLNQRQLPPLSATIQITPAIITALPDTLRQAQKLFDSTGGLHAAALFTTEGELLAVREDVGRHNALDKLIGWGLLNKMLPFQDQIILVSGRASYELLQKCRVAGVAIFCAVSAPSSLAVELAESFGITLIGFLRGDRFNVYTGFERIAIQAEKIDPVTPNTSA
jgi:FdhD protein